MSSAHLSTRRKRNLNSEKNQIRPCDLVWFPSALASAPEHVVLSIQLVSLRYATGTKFHCTGRSPDLFCLLQRDTRSIRTCIFSQRLGYNRPCLTSVCMYECSVIKFKDLLTFAGFLFSLFYTVYLQKDVKQQQ